MPAAIFCILLLFFTTAAAAEEINLPDFEVQTADFHTSEEIQSLIADAHDLLTRRQKSRMQAWLDRSAQYVPLIKVVFAKRGLPEELAYLPLIESGFNPLAVSTADAVGLWQFVEDTGRRYGLRIDQYIDERRDPVKSTAAAADYLKDLHTQFGSWSLALAAYNAGENQMQRIANKVGDDIWKYRYTPSETRRYVPLFLSAVTISKNPELYGFKSPKANSKTRTSKVCCGKSTDLTKFAEKHKTKVKTLKAVNPEIIGDTTPPYKWCLNMPISASKGRI